jgi:hypothetical protein
VDRLIGRATGVDVDAFGAEDGCGELLDCVGVLVLSSRDEAEGPGCGCCDSLA